METPDPEPEAQASGSVECMASFEVQLRDGLSLKRKMNDQSIRDNNAAWVAGPSRICFFAGAGHFFQTQREIPFFHTFPTASAALPSSPQLR
jgi:hypothetical protein